MKKLSKNKFAKLFATFLGASTILTPIATLVSCEQINKTPIEKQNSNSNNNEGGQPGTGGGEQQPGTGGGEQQPGTGGGEQQPGTGGETWQETTLPDGTIQKSITFAENKIIVKEKDKQYSLEGNIYIGDVSTLETKLNELTELNDKKIDTSALNINCFTLKPEGAKPQSIITTREASTVTPPTYLSTEITPSVLKAVLELKKNKKFTTLTLNNKTIDGNLIDILFTTKETDGNRHFDVSDLIIFNFNEDFKLNNKSMILLQDKKDVRAENLLKLIENNNLKPFIKVGKIQLRGNVKNLLPYLVKGNSLEKKYGSVTWEGATTADCTGENWVGYNGITNDDVNFNNTEKSLLKLNELIELKKRSGDKRAYIRNAIIEDLNSTELSTENLADIQFVGDILTNVKFKNSNMSKIRMKITTGPGTIEFEKTTLPKTMSGSTVNNLILKHITIPKEEILKEPFAKLTYIVPEQIGNLEIYGEIKDSILDGATPEQLDSLVPQKNMPPKYKGSQEIYNRLKYIFNGESQIKDFGNYQGSIQKIKDQYLALIQNQCRSRG